MLASRCARADLSYTIWTKTSDKQWPCACPDGQTSSGSRRSNCSALVLQFAIFCNFLHFPRCPILCNFRKTLNHQMSSHVASVHAASLAHFVVLRRITKCNPFQTSIPGPGHVSWSDATLPGMQRWAHRRSEAASQAWGECLRLGCFSHLLRT